MPWPWSLLRPWPWLQPFADQLFPAAIPACLHVSFVLPLLFQGQLRLRKPWLQEPITYQGYLPTSDQLVRLGLLLLMSFLRRGLMRLVLRLLNLYLSVLSLIFEVKMCIPCAHIRACTS